MRLSLSGNPKGKDRVALDVFFDRKTHKLLLEYCKQNQFDLATGFVKAAERGMRFFRAVYYKEMKQDYLLIKEQAEEYERDNKLLRQLVDENERFRQILNACPTQNKEIKDES
jgi:nuclear transport factor 2 (NTF2) superfamily protein